MLKEVYVHNFLKIHTCLYMGLSSYGYSLHRDDKNCTLLFFYQESIHVLDALTLQTKAGN